MRGLEQFSDTYEILGVLGEGSGGIVYKAYHKRLKKEVVLKRIRSQYLNCTNKRQEVDILKNLNHSFLPQVLDFLESENEIYTVMSYIPGKSFQKLLKEGYRFRISQLHRWGMQLCSALHYLHSQKPPIIHSDVKPANIMLTPQGDICLIDFNIAFFLDEHAVLGYSNGYSSPEQYGSVQDQSRGEKKHGRQMVDERSDLYSLGATLYHLAVGKKVDENSGPDEELLVKNSSKAFAQIVLKALQKNSKQRFQTAYDMFQAFQKMPERDERYLFLLKKQRLMRAGLLFLLAFFIVLGGMGLHEIYLERLSAYNDLVGQQITYRENKEYDKSRKVYEQAVNIIPSALESYYQNACTLYEEGDYSGCVEFIDYDILQNEKINDFSDRMNAINYLKADSLFWMEEYEQSADVYEVMLQESDIELVYYRDYAVTLAYLGNYQKAQKILEDAVGKGMLNDSVYYAKGEIEKRTLDYDASLEDFRNCIQETEDDRLKARAYLAMGDIYEEQGEKEKERDLLLEAEQEVLTENQLSVLEELIQTDIDLANNTGEDSYRLEAIEKLNKIINWGWDTLQTYNNLVVLYEKTGELDEAAVVLSKMQDLYGDSYQVYKRYAFLEIDKQELLPNEDRSYDQFDQYYRKAVQLYEERKDYNDTDQEMQLLENVCEQVKEGGWLQ